MREKKIMKRIIIILLCVIFMFISIIIIPTKNRFPYIPFNKLPKSFNNKTITFIAPDRLYLLNNHNLYQMLFSSPFVDYDPHGYTINYNNKTLELYHNNMLIMQQQVLIRDYSKIIYPYFVNSRGTSTILEVYSLLKPSKTPVVVINGYDFFSSYGASPNGNYIIAGNLSGYIYIYNIKTGKTFVKSFKEMSHPFIQGTGIDNDGNYYAIGSYGPKLLLYGNINSNKTDFIKLKNTETSTETLIFTGKNYAFLPLQQGFEVFKVKDYTFTLIPFKALLYRLVIAKKIPNSPNFVLGYFVNKGLYEFTLTTNKNIIKSFFIHSNAIPKVIEIEGISYIIWEGGVIKL